MNREPLAQIERIVREVLAERGLTASARVSDGAKAPAPAAVEPPATTAAELVIHARLVTLADVAGKLDSVRRLVVVPRAVVTPAVRDELRRRDVALVRATAAQARPTAMPRLVLVAARTGQDPAALARGLEEEGVEVQSHRTDCLIAATDQLAGEVTRGPAIGLLWTGYSAAGLCLANRHPGVRAVLATDAPATAEAVAEAGANVLVLDPLALAPFQQKQIVSEFCRGGVRECPEPLKKRLG